MESGELRVFDFEHWWGGDGLYDLATIWMDAELHIETVESVKAREAFLGEYSRDWQVFEDHLCPLYALIRAIGAIAWGLRNCDEGNLVLGLPGVKNWQHRLGT